MPKAAATLSQAHPGLELRLIDRHPVEALQTLRHGEVDVALIYRHADDPTYLVSQRPEDVRRICVRRVEAPGFQRDEAHAPRGGCRSTGGAAKRAS